MPAFKSLYSVRTAQGPVADKAIKLSGKFAAEAGMEIVPTPEAEALVDYLLSLKKDHPIPGVATAVAAAPAPAKK
jgi:cytochrome c oxidase cbb3-type subunit 2